MPRNDSSLKTASVLLGTLLATAATASGAATGDGNPFRMQTLHSGYQLAHQDEDDGKEHGQSKEHERKGSENEHKEKAAEGKCGAEHMKSREGKCGSGS
ncbi:MAG TPA: hypothetical protein ENK05_09550 [Gammaproteobacteria bacterium]|nr:hypothetical protein [Gammaproteobacteria bacterium]